MYMMENISKAFKSLDDLLVESPVYLTEVDEPDAGTIRDLFINDSSYNVLHDFDIGGVQYAIYAEATSGGESCDATYGEFDPNNIDGAIVDLLDSSRNFIGTINGATPDTTLREAEEMAGNIVNVGKDETVSGSSDDERTDAKDSVEPDEPAAAPEPSLDGSADASKSEKSAMGPQIDKSLDGEDSVHIIYKGKDITVSDAKEESLTESKSFDLADRGDLEEAKAEIDKADDDDVVEKIVDASAEAVEDLKKSYIGSMILRCQTCHTMIYKDAGDLAVDEDASTADEKVYNTDDECPHCGSKGGYELIGQVASLDVEEGPQDYTGTHSEDGDAVDSGASSDDSNEAQIDEIDRAAEAENPDKTTPSPTTESLKKEKDDKALGYGISSISETRVRRLIKNYLRETYSNVRDFSVSEAKVDDGKAVVDGVISFKSGNEKRTSFEFEPIEVTKSGKLKLSGVNEAISDRGAFTLTCSLDSGKLLGESMAYCYRIGDEPVRGRVNYPRKR